MRKNIYIILTLLTLFLSFSCGERTQNRQDAIQALKAAEVEARGLSSIEERKAYWEKALTEAPYANNSVARAKIHYQLAGTFYYTGDLDSIKWHIHRAWNLVQNEQDHPEVRALLYYAEGNIATIEGDQHQENYYFNLAIQPIIADSLIDLTPLQKATLFLAAAQSNTALYQYQQAMDWNQRAIRELQRDTVPHPNLLHRGYQQLATIFLNASQGNTDSVYKYINKVEHLVQQYPQQVSPRFLYDSKAHYYDEMSRSDSAIFYYHKILKIDEKLFAGGLSPNAVHYTNLFRGYVNLSESHLLSGQKDSAQHYLERGTDFMEKYDHFLKTSDYVLYRKALVNYFYETGQYQKAFREHNTLLEAQKTNYENRYLQSIAEMSAIYELQAREKAISELNSQVLLTENQLFRNRLLLVIATLSALLAITIVVLLYVSRTQLKLNEEKERVQLQKSAMELEQRLLRTQMEPHFIFNTLAALQSYIRLEEKDKALRYLKQFSRLLRNSLELSRESAVPLDDEIDTLEYYLGLQQMRYEESFDYRVHRPKTNGAYQILIPPMLIQPFVENAILHGVANAKNKGVIEVDMVLRDESLFVTITDNGPGIDTVRQKPSGKKKSLSTSISRERLDILAREKDVQVDVTITDRQKLPGEQTGTRVELRIPVEKDF